MFVSAKLGDGCGRKYWTEYGVRDEYTIEAGLRGILLLEEGLRESLKIAYGWHLLSNPRCPCGYDVDPDEC